MPAYVITYLEVTDPPGTMHVSSTSNSSSRVAPKPIARRMCATRADFSEPRKARSGLSSSAR